MLYKLFVRNIFACCAYVILSTIIVYGLTQYYIVEPWLSVFIFIVTIPLPIFLIVRYYITHTTYKSVEKVSNLITGTSSEKISNHRDTSSLFRNIKTFSTQRNVDIKVLKNRDLFRREFIGNLSHEIKTPLFTIQGYVETLLDGAMNDDKILEKYLQRTAKGIERLSYIIDDLDLITKFELERIKLNYTTFDIIQTINTTFELLELKARGKEIDLRLDKNYTPILIYADRERIQQVITNLIVNSIKYGKIKGTTEVTIHELDNKINIEISDNGEGIQEEYLGRIFERFFRVEQSRSRSEGGSGLGLAIVKHIIDAHKQTIEVNTIYGVGSQFTFSLDKNKKE